MIHFSPINFRNKINMANQSLAVVMAKPGAMKNPLGLFADFSRFSRTIGSQGLQVFAPKFFEFSGDQFGNFYHGHRSSPIFPSLHQDMTETPLMSFIVAGPKEIEIEGGERINFYEYLRGIVGPSPYLSHCSLVKPETVLTLEETQQTLRHQSVIERGASCFRPGGVLPVFNNWHCSETPDARREIGTLYSWQEIRDYFDLGNPGQERVMREQAIDETWRARGNYELMLTEGVVPQDIGNVARFALKIYNQTQAPRTAHPRPEPYRELPDFTRTTALVFARALCDFFNSEQPNAPADAVFRPSFPVTGRIFVVSGAPGSGKTSIVSALNKAEGHNDGCFDYVLPLTTHKSEAADGNEVLVSKSEFERQLEQMAAVEGFGNNCYGVRINDVVKALYEGKNVAVIGGADIFSGLAHFIAELTERSDLVVPVRINIKPEVAVARLTEREKDEKRPAAERIKAFKEVNQHLNQRGLAAGTRGLITVNNDGSLEASVDQLRAALTRPEGPTLPENLGDLFRKNPPTIPKWVVAQMLGESLGQIKLAAAKGLAGQLSALNPDAQANSDLTYVPAFSRFLAELYRVINGSYVLAGDKKTFDFIFGFFQRHLMAAVSAIYEWRAISKGPEVRTMPTDAGVAAGLNINAQEAQVAYSKETMDRVIASSPLEEQILLGVLHDVGKLIAGGWYHWHPELSYKFLTDLEDILLTGIDEKRRPLARLAVKYHHYLGDIFQGRASHLFLSEMVSDPEVQVLFYDKDNKPQKNNIKTFLDMLFFITVADIASCDNLSPTGLYHYAKLRNALEKMLLEQGREGILGQIQNGQIFDEDRLPLVTSENRVAAMAYAALTSRPLLERENLTGLDEVYKADLISSLRKAAELGIIGNPAEPESAAAEWQQILAVLPHFDLPFVNFAQIARPDANQQADAGLTVSPALAGFLKLLKDFYFSQGLDLTENQPSEMIEVVIVDQHSNRVIPFREGKTADGYAYLRNFLLGDAARCPVTVNLWPAGEPQARPTEPGVATDRITARLVLGNFEEDA